MVTLLAGYGKGADNHSPATPGGQRPLAKRQHGGIWEATAREEDSVASNEIPGRVIGSQTAVDDGHCRASREVWQQELVASADHRYCISYEAVYNNLRPISTRVQKRLSPSAGRSAKVAPVLAQASASRQY